MRSRSTTWPTRRTPTSAFPRSTRRFGELRTLLEVVRGHDRVWQCTPDASHRVATFLRFFLTSGRLFGRPLRTSALTAVDLTHERRTWKLFPLIANLLNSSLLHGRFHFQVLATPFRMYAEGAICPIFEEFESSRQLMACDIEDAAARRRIMASEEFGTTVRARVARRRRGLDLQSRPRRADGRALPGRRVAGRDVRRDLPAPAGLPGGSARTRRAVPAESAALASFPNPIGREGAFLLHLVRRYDRDLRWWFTVANDRPEVLEQLLFHQHMLPGFNDSGAHLINLAFFDGNLLTLQMAQRRSLERVAQAVRRLTREPAEFFGVDAGRLDVGAQADLVLIDPEALRSYDTDANRRMVYREIFEHEQLVNRSDGVVTAVFIAGEQVWDGREFSAALGTRKLGRPLTAGSQPAAMVA